MTRCISSNESFFHVIYNLSPIIFLVNKLVQTIRAQNNAHTNHLMIKWLLSFFGRCFLCCWSLSKPHCFSEKSKFTPYSVAFHQVRVIITYPQSVAYFKASLSQIFIIYLNSQIYTCLAGNLENNSLFSMNNCHISAL